MDTELARTFLKIVETGSFVDAADRLHLTQSTVSARIKRLEELLGVPLFERRSDGNILTPAGRQFQRHAALLVRTVERARQEIGIAEGFGSALTVGGRMGLWEGLLSQWLVDFTALQPQVAIRAVIGFEDDLMQALIEGRVDAAVMYVPQARPGLALEPLIEERLVMVSTRADAASAPGADYVFVDWGPEFYAWHGREFPAFAGAAVSVNIGTLGLQHVLAGGGGGYFPLRLVQDCLQKGELHRVPATPEFHLPAYLCFAASDSRADLAVVCDSIRRTATAIGKIDRVVQKSSFVG